mgnify:CR=1 FL=1
MVAQVEEKEEMMIDDTSYAYLVFMYGKHYVDNVLRYIERNEDQWIDSPERYSESMRAIVDIYNKHNNTDYKVYHKPPVIHDVHLDASGGGYHTERKER